MDGGRLVVEAMGEVVTTLKLEFYRWGWGYWAVPVVM